jgi:nucleotide-binding universal stress UspA family protein
VFQKVRVGLDGSESPWCALRRAISLVRRRGTELWVISTTDRAPRFPATTREVRSEQEYQSRHFRDVQLQAQVFALFSDVPVGCRIVTGDAAEVMTHHARAEAFELIVLGPHGHAARWHQLTGSVTHRAVDKARCCVLVDHAPKPGEIRTGEPDLWAP